MIKRIFHGLNANILGQVVGVIIQVIGVPLYLKNWGAVLFGEWLLLTTIPSYFVMTDLGMGVVAGNQITMKVAENNYEEARIIFQTAQFFIIIVSIVLFVSVIGLVQFDFFYQLFHLKEISQIEFITLILLLTVHVIFVLQGGFLNGLYQANKQYARGQYISLIIKFSEFLVMISGVLLGFSLVKIVIFYLFIRVIGTLIWFIDLKAQSLWIEYSYKNIHYIKLKELFLPSVSFMAFPISNILTIQGLNTMVGVVLGPVALVTFTTIRTIVNVIKQMMGVIKHSVWAEFAIAYGKKDFQLMKTLHRYTCKITFGISCLFLIFLFLFGEEIYVRWTDHKVQFDSIFFYLMLILIVSNSFWYASLVVSTAINLHKKLALLNLLSSIIVVFLCYWLLAKLKLNSIPLSLIAVDIFMAYFVIKRSLEITKDTFHDFIKAVFSINKNELRKIYKVTFNR